MDQGLPTSIIDQADCVVVFPSVKKVAIGIGGSYGRGVLVCRNGADMKGDWGAPAMYKLDSGQHWRATRLYRYRFRARSHESHTAQNKS